MSEYELSDHLKKVLRKLGKKDKVRYEAVMSKINEITNSQDIDYHKNLRYDMKDSKRVHIGLFVLVFRIMGNKIYFDDLDHHDKIY